MLSRSNQNLDVNSRICWHMSYVLNFVFTFHELSPESNKVPRKFHLAFSIILITQNINRIETSRNSNYVCGVCLIICFWLVYRKSKKQFESSDQISRYVYTLIQTHLETLKIIKALKILCTNNPFTEKYFIYDKCEKCSV